MYITCKNSGFKYKEKTFLAFNYIITLFTCSILTFYSLTFVEIVWARVSIVGSSSTQSRPYTETRISDLKTDKKTREDKCKPHNSLIRVAADVKTLTSWHCTGRMKYTAVSLNIDQIHNKQLNLFPSVR